MAAEFRPRGVEGLLEFLRIRPTNAVAEVAKVPSAPFATPIVEHSWGKTLLLLVTTTPYATPWPAPWQPPRWCCATTLLLCFGGWMPCDRRSRPWAPSRPWQPGPRCGRRLAAVRHAVNR